MHSSRMRTGRSLTVCRSLLLGGVPAPGRGVSALRGVSASWGRGEGCLLPGGCVLWGLSALGGGVCSQGVSAP